MTDGRQRSRPHALDEARRELREVRRRMLNRLFNEQSFTCAQAMSQMGDATEAYVRALQLTDKDQSVWLAGSLGRREMLPNSDLDIFIIRDRSRVEPSATITVSRAEFDMVEFAAITLGEVRAILSTQSIDANPYVDGRPLDTGWIGQDVRDLIKSISTYDRQVANFVSEYAYYHLFDFNWKRTAYGSNLKYSSGSSRVTLFFNFYNRIVTQRFPAFRGRSPEFIDGLYTAEERFCRHMPRREIELIQAVKNAAMSAYYVGSDPRLRYVSRHSLDVIFEICSGRLHTLGIRDSREFWDAYRAARRAVESVVRDLLMSVLASHPLADALSELQSLSAMEAARRGRQLAAEEPRHEAAVLAVAAWSCVSRTSSPRVVRLLTNTLLDHGLQTGWGGLMAVACAPAADENVLMTLLQWLDSHEPGAYLTKLIARNPTASDRVQRRASESYRRRERVSQFGHTAPH